MKGGVFSFSWSRVGVIQKRCFRFGYIAVLKKRILLETDIERAREIE